MILFPILQVLSVTLNVVEGKAKINPARRVAHITIQLNDEAHGVVEFSQSHFTVKEKDHNATAYIPIVRTRGTHGALCVFYRYSAFTSSTVEHCLRIV